MDEIIDQIDGLATATDFSGVVRVDHGGVENFARAYGSADRAHRVDNTVATQFGIASGTKGFTALAMVGLIERGLLELSTTARSLLGPDLPLIDNDVTIEHLLSHRSGIGDYLDEDTVGDITDYVMTVPVHQLASIESYLCVLDGHPSKFTAGTQFSYCNGGYVVLSLLAERVAGTAFSGLVDRHVCQPAGLTSTAFLRSDELPGRAATGYLGSETDRTNVLHLPVVGSGDGGIYTTVADIHALWEALFAGRIVSPDWVFEMIRPRSEVPEESSRCGMGFWLHAFNDTVMLSGGDAGVSFRSSHSPSRQVTCTVVSNTSGGAWPVARHLDGLFAN